MNPTLLARDIPKRLQKERRFSRSQGPDTADFGDVALMGHFGIEPGTLWWFPGETFAVPVECTPASGQDGCEDPTIRSVLQRQSRG